MRRAAAGLRDLDGILLLDKPAGPSSNQALQRARRLLGARKAGHAGTLDPLATGLLPVLLGEATKFSGSLSEADKVYEATIWFGVTTTTGDLDGEIVDRRAAHLTIEQVVRVAEQFRGNISQVPPMHSALKVAGRPLYERARRGETIERASRSVHVKELAVRELRGDECDIRVHCSKGTYIRALAEDIGQALGCGATLKRLRRTAVGAFAIEAAITLEELESRGAPCAESKLLPIDAALAHLPAIRLAATVAAQVLRGQRVAVQADETTHARLYDGDSDRFLGVGRVVDGTLQARRLVASDTRNCLR